MRHCIGRGGGKPAPPPPSTAPSLCPATVSLTAMAFVTDSKCPQPLWQPPATACLTASGAASAVPSLLMHLWGLPAPVGRLGSPVSPLSTVHCAGETPRLFPVVWGARVWGCLGPDLHLNAPRGPPFEHMPRALPGGSRCITSRGMRESGSGALRNDADAEGGTWPLEGT